jgi:hypothetical protein
MVNDFVVIIRRNMVNDFVVISEKENNELFLFKKRKKDFWSLINRIKGRVINIE